MKNKNFKMVVDLMQDDSNPFMSSKQVKKPEPVVKKVAEIEEYPEEMKVEYVNVMPSYWIK